MLPVASKRRFVNAFAASLPVAFVGGAASTQDRRRRNGRPPAARCDFKIGRAIAVRSVRARPPGAPRFTESSTYCAVVGPASLGVRRRPSVANAAVASSQGSCAVRVVWNEIVPPRDDQPLPRRANRRLWSRGRGEGSCEVWWRCWVMLGRGGLISASSGGVRHGGGLSIGRRNFFLCSLCTCAI